MKIADMPVSTSKPPFRCGSRHTLDVAEIALDDSADVPTTGRRRGRPPATDSAETRSAIFEAARRLFAERGYGAVTNKDVATAAGITPGALYHYVESKRDLYAAVHADVQTRVYGRFTEAVESCDTFIGKFEAVLEAANAMNLEDQSLALFLGAVRIDIRRYDELRGKLSNGVAVRDQFFTGLVDIGIETGEIEPENRSLVIEFIRVILIGLTDVVTPSVRDYRGVTDGIKAAMRGRLIQPAP